MGAAMRNAMLSIRDRLDRVGVLLSGLCALHCLAGLLLVAGLGLGGEYLLAPIIHRVGLALAIVGAMLAAILGFIAAAWRTGRTSALLFLPYAAWVAFATALNAAIYMMN